MIWELDGTAPILGDGVWIAPDAQVMGRVELADGVSVWWGAVLRGDNDAIRVGRGSNIQDRCVLHTDTGLTLQIGADVTVGHGAIVHGCTIGDGALIGMGAVILNRAVIGAGALIAAGALIPEGKEIPAGALVMGNPGRVVRMLDPEAREGLRLTAAKYQRNAARFARDLNAVE